MRRAIRYLTDREVTLLAPLEPMPPDAFTGAALLEWLDSPPFRNGPPGDPDAMVQIIAANRNAWEKKR